MKIPLMELDAIEFNATKAILSLEIEDVRAIQDNHESSDAIGRLCVPHHGPCETEIVDSLCEFFGVDCPQNITENMLKEARLEYSSRPLQHFLIQVTRTDTAHKDFEVQARDVGEAQEMALRAAYNYHWSHGTAGYEADLSVQASETP